MMRRNGAGRFHQTTRHATIAVLSMPPNHTTGMWRNSPTSVDDIPDLSENRDRKRDSFATDWDGQTRTYGDGAKGGNRIGFPDAENEKALVSQG